MTRKLFIYADILHIYFSPGYKSLSDVGNLAPVSVRQRMKIGFKYLLKLAKQLCFETLSESEWNQAQGKVWLYALSKNNKDSLAFIHENLLSIYVCDKHRNEFSNEKYIVPNLRFQLLHFYKYPILLIFLLCKNGSWTLRISNTILRTCGYLEECKRILKVGKPKMIVFSNDHNFESRSFMWAAKQLEIPTVYLQHASVSASFPALKFDLNLLEGKDALDKYLAIGKAEGKIVLVGMPKFDSYLKYRKKRGQIKRIGIPYNLNDNLAVVEQLIVEIHAEFPDKIISIRKHPKDKTNFTFISKFPYLVESNPNDQSAFDFLITQDCIIAGNSSIHLEATLLNMPSVYFNMSSGTFINDYYGYVKNGLVEAAINTSEVVSMIKKESSLELDIFMKAGYYNATVGTEFEGNSKKLAMKYIESFIEANDPHIKA